MNEPIHKTAHVICPTCGTQFDNNKVDGLALVSTVQKIDARKRMYCKLSLDDLERLSKSSGTIAFPEAKKIVLDNFNDFVRDIQTILGLGNEVE